jgi:hypothetical protein
VVEVVSEPVPRSNPEPVLELAPEPEPAEELLVPPLTAPLLRLPSADRATA